MPAHAIELQEVEKTYRSAWGKNILALNKVSFSVEQGEAFGFVGQNGAGKSTTIRILTGAMKPSSGKAYLFGGSVNDFNARNGLGYVPENPYLYDYLTPFELVLMGVQLHKVKLGEQKKHCDYWLERFNIAHAAHRPIRSLSKGMTQRTALAHALALQPRLLILDEPLSGLDPLGRKDVVDILVDYKKQGGTLFFSSHVLHDVERLADRFGLIHKGKLHAVRTPADILNDAGGLMIVRYRGDNKIDGAVAESPGVWRSEVKRTQLVTTLQAVDTAQGLLTEVKSAATLESAFLNFVQESEEMAAHSPD